MAQTWHELLFAHWPIPVTALRPLIPEPLSVDTFEGQAWLGVIPFRMSGVRMRATPALPWLSAFPELNVRTYVTAGDKPGVWFFSLDAANAVAVAVARAWFHLPYFRARMRSRARAGWIEYESERPCEPRAIPAYLALRYRPQGGEFEPVAGTLVHWLTERYCLYALDPRGGLYRGEIHHAPWRLRDAQAEFAERNTMARVHGLELPPVAPLLHFAECQQVAIWAPQKIGDGGRAAGDAP